MIDTGNVVDGHPGLDGTDVPFRSKGASLLKVLDRLYGLYSTENCCSYCQAQKNACDKESRTCAQQMRYSLLKESLDVARPLL